MPVNIINPPTGGAGVGPAGPPGPAGSSAYALAVSNGYSGTVEEWLSSLVGPQGLGLEGGTPYLVASYDAEGNLVFTNTFYDSSGEATFSFAGKAKALTSENVERSKIDAKLATVAGNATEYEAFEEIANNFDNIKTRIEELAGVFRDYEMLR